MARAGSGALKVRRTILASLAAAAVSLPVCAHFADPPRAGALRGATGLAFPAGEPSPLPARRAMQLGINLFGIDTGNRQQVFANMIAQSEWFEARTGSWKAFPPAQLDPLGWIRYLEPGQTAPRPLVLPPAPFRTVRVHCTFAGKGELGAGGVARVVSGDARSLDLELAPTGAEGEGAWLTLMATDRADPLRDLDCRREGTSPAARFDPAFMAFASDFAVIRFMDWQHTNQNPRSDWSARTLPRSSSQVGAGGVSVEDMVDLAKAAGADPWFTMPYHADEAWVRAFARLVHDRLGPERRVYVELGNEVWNDLFPAARDARAEGIAMGLGGGDPARAQMERYAQRMVAAMRVWSEVYADRPGALVRVAATQNANPALAAIVLGHGDSAEWVDALATAPYFWLEVEGRKAADADAILAELPAAIERTFAMARENRRIAAAHGKRYIAYEGGQHLVTRDLALARALQRDPRMGDAYARYLAGWREGFGDTLTLYASTAPIAEYGSWGLREYGGQPLAQAPKYRAVRHFLEGHK